MRYSPEALVAFTEAASLGSFSAAARKLRKSQSTVSIAIANFEADIGCPLFDRNGRHPTLNEAGRQVLSKLEAARAALDAGVDACVEAWHHAAADHPVLLNFPEGEYLKGLVCRVAL